MSSTTDQILIPSARQKIPSYNNNVLNTNNNNERSNNKNQSINNNNNNSYHKKSQSTPPQQINNNSSSSLESVHHSQPITINSSFNSKNQFRNKNKNNQSSGSFKKSNDQTLSREIDQPQQSNTSASPIDNNTRSRAKSFQNSPQSTPPQALSNKPNKQLLNVSSHVHSKSIPNSPNDTFEVSKSTLININNNNNTSSPSKSVKIMTPPYQRKKKQFVEDNYSSSAPSKISLQFDDNEEENELLDEVLDDLCIRFVLNCPTLEEEQMEGIDSRVFETLFFQLEEAFWFYYDFHRVKHKSLPKYKFSMFCEKMFTRCPTLLEELTQNDSSQVDVDSLVQRFLDYKTSVPVYGCIILNENLDKVLLVQGYNTKSWSFPKGKINQNEKESTCAAREVYEECGYELGDRVSEQDFIEIEQNYESSVPDYKDKYKHSNPYTKLFIVSGIPESTNFATRTRKEILKIKWFSIDYLYETCYPRHKDKQGLRTWLVKPFLNSLIDWIKKRKQSNNPKTPDKKPPVNRSNRSLTAPAIPNLSVSTIVTQNNQPNVGSPLLSFVFDTEEILEKKK